MSNRNTENTSFSYKSANLDSTYSGFILSLQSYFTTVILNVVHFYLIISYFSPKLLLCHKKCDQNNIFVFISHGFDIVFPIFLSSPIHNFFSPQDTGMELKTYNGPSASRIFTHQNIDIACIISYPMLLQTPMNIPILQCKEFKTHLPTHSSTRGVLACLPIHTTNDQFLKCV